MKKILILLIVLTATGCKRQLQDFGIVPEDSQPKFDTKAYPQWWAGDLPISKYGYAEEGDFAFPSKVFQVYWGKPFIAQGQERCEPLNAGALEQFDTEQIGRTTPYALVSKTGTHFRVDFLPISEQSKSCFSIYSSPN